MSKEDFLKNIKTFHEQIEQRLTELNSPQEKQQYLEGVVHAFDAMTRYAGLADLTPFEQQNFIGDAKSWAYSKTYHLILNPDKYMKPLIESDGEYVAKAYKIATELQALLGIPLDPEEQMRLTNVCLVAVFEKQDRKRPLNGKSKKVDSKIVDNSD